MDRHVWQTMQLRARHAMRQQPRADVRPRLACIAGCHPTAAGPASPLHLPRPPVGCEAAARPACSGPLAAAQVAAPAAAAALAAGAALAGAGAAAAPACAEPSPAAPRPGAEARRGSVGRAGRPRARAAAQHALPPVAAAPPLAVAAARRGAGPSVLLLGQLASWAAARCSRAAPARARRPCFCCGPAAGKGAPAEQCMMTFRAIAAAQGGQQRSSTLPPAPARGQPLLLTARGLPASGPGSRAEMSAGAGGAVRARQGGREPTEGLWGALGLACLPAGDHKPREGAQEQGVGVLTLSASITRQAGGRRSASYRPSA